MIELLAAPPGEIRHPKINQKYATLVLDEWRAHHVTTPADKGTWKITSNVKRMTDKGEEVVGEEKLTLFRDGRFKLDTPREKGNQILFDGQTFFMSEGDGFVPLTTVEAKTDLRLMAAYGIAAPLLKKPLEPLGTTLIDGSDRSVGDVSWRLRVDDADEDATYVWIEVNREYGQCDTARMLRKIAPNTDCGEEGGVLFTDFETTEGLAVPKTRMLVSGLFEKPTHSIELTECQWSDAMDESVFDKLPKPEKPEPEAETKVDENGAEHSPGDSNASEAGTKNAEEDK
jgi:hypothetical protein